jgi:Xaa-Pro aminopeptidase
MQTAKAAKYGGKFTGNAVKRREIRFGERIEIFTLTPEAPSSALREKENILSSDSGENLHDFLGGLCRMAVLGEPTQPMKNLLGEVQAVQSTALSAVETGSSGNEIIDETLAEHANCAHNTEIHFRRTELE